MISKAPLVVKLCGEHAVVYGYRAISCAIDRYVYTKIENIDEDKIILKFRNIEEEYDNKIEGFFKYVKYCIKIFEEEILGKKIRRLKIITEIDRDVEPGSGLGTSAATISSTISALCKYYNIKLDRKYIAELSFKIEKGVQGRASRMDTYTSTLGGILLIKSESIEKINVDIDWLKMSIVLIRKLKSTKELVDRVAKLYEKYRGLISKIFEAIDMCSEEIIKGLYMRDEEYLGKVVTTCHWLLNCLDVVDDRTNKIVIELLNTGYFTGAKISGAGYGGAILAILKRGVDTIVLENLKVKHNSNAFKILHTVRISDGGIEIYE